jgi:uncharacterized protein YbjQ (UPF0145 family)
MRYFRYGIMLSALLLTTLPAFAADEVLMLPIASAMATPQAQQKLGNSVKFYFGTHPATRVIRTFGNTVANPKTNGFAKSAGTACEWVFLSALISLQERAAEVGANAVVNITSFYDKHEVSSQTEYECHKGFLMAGVALRGDLVRLADH